MRDVGHYRDGVNSQKGIKMTEMVDTNQSSTNFAPSPDTSSSTPAPAQAPASSNEERTFRQQEVNDIAARRAAEAVERYKRESSMASRQSQEQQQGTHSQAQPAHHSGMSESEYRRIAAEEAQRSRSEWEGESQRKAQEQHAQQIANEFFTKVGAGEGGIEGFHKMIESSGIDLQTIPYHVQLANNVDNTREVMEELIKNPSKIGTLQNLIDIDLRAGRQPNLAMAEMKRLSQTIKDNAQATNFRGAKQPLSQLRPSNAGTDNKGPLQVSDYKARYRV